MKLSRRSVVAGLVVGVVSLVVALTMQQLFTYAKRKRSRLQQVECMGRMVQTKLALEAYAADNGGWLPLSLDALVNGKFRYVEPRNLCCPTSGMEYLYVLAGRGGRLDALGPNQPLLADAGFPHSGGKRVLNRGGGHQYIPKERFEEASAKHPASFDEALRAALSLGKSSPDGPDSE